jgi:FKBP-type peptidyl-prolyl cis-trans isomerase
MKHVLINRIMNINKYLLPIIFLVILLQSCGNSDYQRKKDGLIYRIIATGKGDVTKPRTYVKLHQKVVVGDSILYSSFTTIPTYGFFDSIQVPSHDFLDMLHEMRVGDSAIVVRSVDSLQRKGQLEYNDIMKKGGTIKVYIKLLSTFKNEADMLADQQKVIEAFKLKEIANLEKYVAGLNLKNVVKTPEGVLVAIEKEGTGARADSGMYVKVKYTGKLKNGNVFDSNIDTAFGHAEPFGFTVGQRQVIEGWDAGLKKLNAGTKAKIFIPSFLGYGPSGSGPKIPPFSDLIFDIEVLEVSAAAPAPPSEPVNTGQVSQGQNTEAGHEEHNH